MMQIHHVCVFCGSKKGNNPAHTQFARKLGEEFAKNKIGLVFGGGSVGLMNEIANAVIKGGGHTHGIIPTHLNKKERTHAGVARLDVTDSMHERKAKMSAFSDAYIALPGGFGTFEELLEVITWAHLGLHAKPIILANVDGYYDKLIEFIDHAVTTDFISSESRHSLKIATSVAQCVGYLMNPEKQNRF